MASFRRGVFLTRQPDGSVRDRHRFGSPPPDAPGVCLPAGASPQEAAEFVRAGPPADALARTAIVTPEGLGPGRVVAAWRRRTVAEWVAAGAASAPDRLEAVAGADPLRDPLTGRPCPAAVALVAVRWFFHEYLAPPLDRTMRCIGATDVRKAVQEEMLRGALPLDTARAREFLEASIVGEDGRLDGARACDALKAEMVRNTVQASSPGSAPRTAAAIVAFGCGPAHFARSAGLPHTHRVIAHVPAASDADRAHLADLYDRALDAGNTPLVVALHRHAPPGDPHRRLVERLLDLGVAERGLRARLL